MLFIGAMITLCATQNRAERHHRETFLETKRQETERWRRDTLLRLCSESLESAIQAEGDYFKAVHTGADMKETVTAIDVHARRIGANAGSLHIIGAHQVADACVAVRSAINNGELVERSMALNSILRSMAHSKDADRLSNLNAQKSEATTRFDAALNKIVEARSTLISTAESEVTKSQAVPD